MFADKDGISSEFAGGDADAGVSVGDGGVEGEGVLAVWGEEARVFGGEGAEGDDDGGAAVSFCDGGEDEGLVGLGDGVALVVARGAV